MKRLLIAIIVITAILFGTCALNNTEQKKLERNFDQTASEMNKKKEDANKAIEEAVRSINEHKQAICTLSEYKLKKLIPETDEALKHKVMNNCDVIPDWINEGWGMDFLFELEDISSRDNPINNG